MGKIDRVRIEMSFTEFLVVYPVICEVLTESAKFLDKDLGLDVQLLENSETV